VHRGGELRFEQTYENTGSTDMPFSFGFPSLFRVSDVRNLEWDIKAGLTADPDTAETRRLKAWISL
jgi:galactose mutarotase-like enzyme